MFLRLHVVIAQENDVPKDITEAARIELSDPQSRVVRIRSGDDTSSGSIVSPQGLVLTVAHGIQPDRGPVRIQTTDGKIYTSTLLIHNTVADVAVLRIEEDSPQTWPFIELASDESVQKDQVALALGFPGRTSNERSPTVRIGRIIAAERDVIRTSCTLTVGDSGGPLLNSSGRLIGIHRQIGVGAESNLHAASLLAKPELEKAGWQRDDPMEASSIITADQLQANAKVVNVLRSRTIEVRSEGATDKSIRGTLLAPDLVVTKLSELPDAESFDCVSLDGHARQGCLQNTDRALDLAVIRLTSPIAVSIASSPSPPKLCEGLLIFAADENQLPTCGVVSFVNHQEPPLSGRLGARFTSDSGRPVKVAEVLPNGTAALAGFAVGDELRSVEGQEVRSLDEIAAALKEYQPGDRIQMNLKRGTSDVMPFHVRLQHDAGERFTKMEFLDGRSGELSERRSGFASVVQHDISVRPNDCGGPLCDSTGRVIGLTIARRSREASLAIPIEQVLATAEQMKNP